MALQKIKRGRYNSVHAVALDLGVPMKRFSLAVVFLLLLGLSGAALAQQKAVDRQFKGEPETDIKVGIFTSIHRNCTAAPLPVVRLVTPPAHGKVTVKQGRLRATNLKQCLGAELPAFVAIYRSARDYIGQDVFTLEVIGTKGKSQLHRITVTVMKPGHGQGI
jgi:hypothetical protein